MIVFIMITLFICFPKAFMLFVVTGFIWIETDVSILWYWIFWGLLDPITQSPGRDSRRVDIT